jgi:Tfp pilus assembly protein PilN
VRQTRIDFLAAPRGSARLGIAVFVIGAALAGFAVMDDSRSSDDLARLQASLKKAKTAYQRVELTRTPDRGSGLSALKQSGDIARRLASPWGELLDALEHAQSDNVALLAVEPSVAQGRLRISGEAKDMDALIDYIKSLEGKAGIADLRLQTQQIKQNDAQHPLEFVLESHWQRATPRASVAEVSS